MVPLFKTRVTTMAALQAGFPSTRMLRFRLNHVLLLVLNCLLLMLLLSQNNFKPNLGLLKNINAPVDAVKNSHESFEDRQRLFEQVPLREDPPKAVEKFPESEEHEPPAPHKPVAPHGFQIDLQKLKEAVNRLRQVKPEVNGEDGGDNAHRQDVAHNLAKVVHPEDEQDSRNPDASNDQENDDQESGGQRGNNKEAANNERVLPKNAKVIRSTHYKGGYCVAYNYWKPDDKWNTSITYVVHSTMPFIKYMQELVEVWNGPISIGVYMPAPNFDYDATKEQNLSFMEALAKFESYRKVKETGKVGIHLLFDRPSEGCEDFVYSEDQLSTDYEYLKHMYDHAGHIPNYPCQQLRNVARFGMNTRLFVASDIENIPASRYVERMLPLAQKLLIEERRKIVLVHRRFEVSELVPMPRTKTELKILFDKKQAVEFHKIFYAAGHSIPYLDEWFKVPEDLEKGSVFSTVPYTNGEWEPQFVADSDAIALHDESFPYPHRGHTELGYETCRAGFQFAVVNDLFTLHPGIKTSASAGEKKGAQHSQRHYREVVYRFKRRMDRTYWKTRGQCGEFKA
ncbi:unnamed protein product [Bursaphelenchus xylophilus]|uniref:(pine wood nematode) hypothetical protein n=1 Tax=Bursaphelenchus xylophilus TaxID=6326 RepID=A0A7I8X7U6_BURXY|nr:unnamed protein product [Bursaphelenchus xylophilus]CAG9125755.1 unnamed protein product [Bursaphelenchus xylophilus]